VSYAILAAGRQEPWGVEGPLTQTNMVLLRKAKPRHSNANQMAAPGAEAKTLQRQSPGATRHDGDDWLRDE
jgi:hypothetical protein